MQKKHFIAIWWSDPIRLRAFSFLFSLSITLVMLGVIGWFLIDQLTFVQRAPTAIVKGKITDVTIDSSGTENATCNGKIQFYTNHKQRIEITQGLSSTTTTIGWIGVTSCNGKVGDIVDVAYHIADPYDARVIPPGGFLLGNWFLFAGFIFVLLAGGTLTLFSFLGMLEDFKIYGLAKKRVHQDV